MRLRFFPHSTDTTVSTVFIFHHKKMNRFPAAIVLLLFTASLSSAMDSDGLSLLALKSAINHDPRRVLLSWSDSEPCSWFGVTCTRRRVTGLNLSACRLWGYIPSELGALLNLDTLSLSHNNFSQVIPAGLFAATSLRSLDLSHNSLDGSVPSEIKNLQNLTHLDLSSNFLNGTLPPSLKELKNLSGLLNLSYNLFSGEVPAEYGDFPVMVSLDIGHNNLTGGIPQVGSLLNQGPTAFIGNPNLCGFPLQTPCPESQSGQFAVNSPNPVRDGSKRARLVICLPLGASTVIMAVVFLAWLARRKNSEGKNAETKEEGNQGKKGKFVVLGEDLDMELEDLLRASAYMVAKGGKGIVYRVVVRAVAGVPPRVVAVRRLSEGEGTWRLKEFESEVDAIGKVFHPNVVRLMAYYYADDEKLLVYDFVSNLNLHIALHGGSSAASSIGPFSWPARLRIAQGIARGLMHIHEFGSRKYHHGSLRSSKILLDDDLQPHIADFGLDRLFSLANASFRMPNQSKISLPNHKSNSSAYLAPEARIPGGKVTQKCDVYSFGVVLLEILTGRLPDVDLKDDGNHLRNLARKVISAERPLSDIIDPEFMQEIDVDEAIAMIHVALTCTELDPEPRPNMRTACENLDRIST